MVRRGLIVLVLVGCGPNVSVPSGESGEDSTGGVGTTGVPVTTALESTGTVPGSTSGPNDTGFATFSTAPPDTTGDFDFTTTELISDTFPPSGQCMSNEECESGMCFLAGILGGICSECLSDADCRWGCTMPNPLTSPPTGAMCSDGTIGGGCETDGACMDPLLCGLIVDVPGVLSVRTCGECLVDADCSDGQVCSPDVRIHEIAGERECVDPGSKANGESCNLEGTGAECTSTHCAHADIMGLVEIGVCSECNNVTGEGCDDGLSCEPPIVDLDGTMEPGTCV